MRTTLAIDDDLLKAVQARADAEKRSLDEVVTTLLRRALGDPGAHQERNGIILLRAPSGNPQVTPEIVDALRDELD